MNIKTVGVSAPDFELWKDTKNSGKTVNQQTVTWAESTVGSTMHRHESLLNNSISLLECRYTE